jgi:hypothetical protein
LIALLALAACQVTPGLPVNDAITASVQRSTDNEFDRTTMIIRSYRADENGDTQEIAGAVCSGRNGLVSFRNAITPAAVRMPTYLQADRFANRGRPPALSVSCRLDGQTARVVVQAMSQAGNTTTTGTGVYNPNTGTTTTPVTTRLDGRLSSTLPWFYPGAQVEF